MSDTDSTEHPGEAAEEAGIVDQQAAAIDAMEDEDAEDES